VSHQAESREVIWRRVAAREREMAEEASELFKQSCEPIFWECALECLQKATTADRIADLMRVEEEKLQTALAFAELAQPVKCKCGASLRIEGRQVHCGETEF